jgi:hypothetical protein
VARARAPGGVASLGYVAMAGNSFVLWLALPAPPVATPFGMFALDLASLVTVVAGVVPPAGSVTLALPVPNLALLQGLAVAVQAVDVPPAASLQLSNAAAIVLY